MLTGIIGPGAQSVRHLGANPQHHLQIQYTDGRIGFINVGQTTSWLPFYATIVTERSVAQFIADNAKLYRALLEIALPYLAGDAPSPMSPEDWIEPELCALAARQSWLNNDLEIKLSDFSSDTTYDGQSFAKSYHKARYPNGW